MQQEFRDVRGEPGATDKNPLRLQCNPTTGLYEDFEQSFGPLAMAFRGYIEALSRITSEPEDQTAEEWLVILREILKTPIREYVAYLKDQPDINADEILKTSISHPEGARSILRVDAAIRTLNQRLTDYVKDSSRADQKMWRLGLAESLDILYRIATGRDEEFTERVLDLDRKTN